MTWILVSSIRMTGWGKIKFVVFVALFDWLMACHVRRSQFLAVALADKKHRSNGVFYLASSFEFEPLSHKKSLHKADLFMVGAERFELPTLSV